MKIKINQSIYLSIYLSTLCFNSVIWGQVKWKVSVWICAVVNENGLLESSVTWDRLTEPYVKRGNGSGLQAPQMNDRCDIFPANTNIFSDFSCWGYTRDKKTQTTVTAKWGWILFLDFFIYFYNFHSIPRPIVALHVKTGCSGRTRWSCIPAGALPCWWMFWKTVHMMFLNFCILSFCF